ncbi:MAG: hypothetical protein ACK5PP_08445 [Acidimicrobiales bacterium]
MTSIDRILFGDNQFFGVNHMSEEKARAQAMRFRDVDAIISVLDTAYELGIRSFMCTTHDQIGAIADYVAANPARYEGFVFLPGMPYAHKYANMVGELGMVDTLRAVTPGGLVEAMVRGAKSTLSMGRDLDDLLKMLVDAEMARFAQVDTPVIFLQNVLADLLLGLGATHFFAAFADYVGERYGAEAGFFTMNLPAMVPALHKAGIENPIVCCNYNLINFRMAGGIEAYDEVLANEQCRVIAMSVLASGAIPADEAIDWICSRPQIESIVFGASSRGNIANTIDLIETFDTRRRSVTL